MLLASPILCVILVGETCDVRLISAMTPSQLVDDRLAKGVHFILCIGHLSIFYIQAVT